MSRNAYGDFWSVSMKISPMTRLNVPPGVWCMNDCV